MKTRNVLLLILGIFANFLLETVLQSRIQIFGLLPDSVIVFTVVIGVNLGSAIGATYGTVVGVLIDMMYGPYVGFYTLAYTLCGYLSGLFNTQYFSQHLFVPPIFAFLFCLFKELVMYGQLRIAGLHFEVGSAIWRYFIPSAAITALLTVPIFAIMRQTWRTEWRRARWENLREE